MDSTQRCSLFLCHFRSALGEVFIIIEFSSLGMLSSKFFFFFFIKLICQSRNPFWRRLGCKGRLGWMCEYYVHKCLLGRLFPADMTKRWEIRSQISLTTQTLKEKWSQLTLMGLVRRMSCLCSSCQSHTPSWTTPKTATTASLSSGAGLGHQGILGGVMESWGGVMESWVGNDGIMGE